MYFLSIQKPIRLLMSAKLVTHKIYILLQRKKGKAAFMEGQCNFYFKKGQDWWAVFEFFLQFFWVFMKNRLAFDFFFKLCQKNTAKYPCLTIHKWLVIWPFFRVVQVWPMISSFFYYLLFLEEIYINFAIDKSCKAIELRFSYAKKSSRRKKMHLCGQTSSV